MLGLQSRKIEALISRTEGKQLCQPQDDIGSDVLMSSLIDAF